MLQKIKYKDIPVFISGMGTIDDSRPIDLLEYALPVSKEKNTAYPVKTIPNKITVSKKIGQTVYDITGCFDSECQKSLLQQFKDLILSANTAQSQN